LTEKTLGTQGVRVEPFLEDFTKLMEVFPEYCNGGFHAIGRLSDATSSRWPQV